MLERYLKRLSRLWPAECWCWVCRWFSSCSGFWQWYQIQNTDTDWGLATDGWRQPSPGDPVHYCSLLVSPKSTLNPDMDFGLFSPLHVIKKTIEGPFTAAVLSEKKPWSRNLINDIYYLYKLYEPPPGPAPPLAPITRVMYLCQPSISNVHFLSWPQYIYYNKFIISFVCFVLTLKHWSDVSIMLL